MSKVKCVVAKEGRILMANENTARKFVSKTTARAFIRNLNRVSKRTTLRSFEIIPV
jgi:hypothetical protein